MVREPSISVIRHDRYPAIYVADHIWKCTVDLFSRLVQAAILKSEAVLAVFYGNLITLKEIFQTILSKSQQVFASAYQRLVGSFHSENSTEKMLL